MEKAKNSANYIVVVILVLVAFYAGSMWKGRSQVKEESGKEKVAQEVDKEVSKENGDSESKVLAAETVNKMADDGVVMGSEDAPVTILMFTDLTCPYCGAAAGHNKEVIDYLKSKDASWEPAVPNIIKNYVDTGKARLVFRYYPGHGSGAEAMQAMYCAEEKGKFWELHDLFFANPDKLENMGDFLPLVASVGLDEGEIRQCVESKTYEKRLEEDTAAGRKVANDLQLRFGTPAFFINGEPVIGARSYSDFEPVIEKALSS